MKRCILLLLCLLLLTGCSTDREEMVRPVRFYYGYRNAQSGDYGAESGALGWELRDLGAELMSMQEVLQLYLQGPEDTQLRTPFPKGLLVEQVAVEDAVLVVSFDGDLQSLTGVDRTLAAACLVQTMTQFSGIDAVSVTCEGEPIWTDLQSSDRYLLLDDTATSDAMTMKIYYGTQDGRYLEEETRTNSFQSEEEIPLYILHQLLDGPVEKDGRALMPSGTRVLGTVVDNGVCTVNFSESFLWYQPSTNLSARLMVLSVVNSLTELPEIACVQILCGGNPIDYYMGLDLSEPLYRDETAFLKEAEGKDVTLYVPCGTQERLAPVPVLLERYSEETLVTDVLNALLSVETVNSYKNPFPEGTVVLSTEVAEGICTVTFNAAFAMSDADPVQARKAVRSVVATLCELDGIDQVCIEIRNGKLTTVDLSNPMSVEKKWLLPG